MLKNKTILIISPNYWGKMFISKHHYAVELARRGNTVYFLNPPDLKRKYIEIEKSEIHHNLFIISYKPIYRAKLLLPRFVFDILVWIQVKFLLMRIGKPIDLLWSFSFSIFTRLNFFNAKFNIHHPVDQILSIDEKLAGRQADVIFSTLDFVLDNYKEYHKPMHFITHGLNDNLAEFARKNLKSENTYSPDKSNVKVAFIGNLLKKFIDIETFKTIIIENQNCTFYIYGSYRIETSNLGSYKNTEFEDFIKFLQSQKNVILKGVFPPEELAKEMQQMDAFLICIDTINDDNKGSNPHKVIEYLSTGKVIISNYLETYKNHADIIQMPMVHGNETLPMIFSETISNIEHYNQKEFQRKRIEFALDNTYSKQIERIEEIIGEVRESENKR